MNPAASLYLLAKLAKEFDAEEKTREATAIRAGAEALERETTAAKVGLSVKRKPMPMDRHDINHLPGLLGNLRSKI